MGQMEQLKPYLERAMALQAALVLFEWDNETLAPEQAGKYTAKVQGALSEAYQEIMTKKEVRSLLEKCGQEPGLTERERAIVREAAEEYDKLEKIPPQEYRAYQ